MTRSTPDKIARAAENIRTTLRTQPPANVPAWRALRRRWSCDLRSWSPQEVINLCFQLIKFAPPWGRLTAYELIASHPGTINALTEESLLRLGHDLADWASVDTFACYLAGPAWREGRLPTRQIHVWLRSKNRWERRTGVVCTVALNVRARGGSGDTNRTLDVCRRVAADHDDMVVKAVSWALRSLVEWDPLAVTGFLKTHEAVLAARIKREVGNKLQTGLKNPRQTKAV